MPKAEIEAWDISSKALEVANQNSLLNKTSILFREVDILKDYPTTPKFDIIVSNPPYILDKEKIDMDMVVEDRYMRRCLQLAANGKGSVSPNPLVGAVIVNNGKIIGEGYHREYGKAHAEVNAINSVKDKSLLQDSTIYVSLEPCSHYGKTPPCSQLIIDSGIPRVVIATLDPYHEVSGRGVKMLRNAGIGVVIGVLEKESQELNKEFFCYNNKNRPYIYLKWAQTNDGFIDKKRYEDEVKCPTIISNELTQILVHKLRSQVSGIMVATNTAINDNPSLTTRFWHGQNPARLILDRTLRIPESNNLFDGSVNTYIFTEQVEEMIIRNNVTYIPLLCDKNMLNSLLNEIYKLKIDSLLVEGGAQLLDSFIKEGIWDEAFIEVSDQLFFEGKEAPMIKGKVLNSSAVMSSVCLHVKNN